VLVLQHDYNNRPVHVLRGIPNRQTTPATLITAYRPSSGRWLEGFLRRRPCPLFGPSRTQRAICAVAETASEPLRSIGCNASASVGDVCNASGRHAKIEGEGVRAERPRFNESYRSSMAVTCWPTSSHLPPCLAKNRVKRLGVVETAPLYSKTVWLIPVSTAASP
jgi:hypothetical protein